VLFALKAIVLTLTLCVLPLAAGAHSPHQCTEGVPDAPTFTGHIRQAGIAGGRLRFQEIFAQRDSEFLRRQGDHNISKDN
jgi:hypothetical protein